MSKKRSLRTMAASAAAIGAAGWATKKVLDTTKEKKEQLVKEEIADRTYDADEHVYLIGGGIATLSAALYLIRDAQFPAEQIHVIEALDVLGGSNDGAGSNEEGFVCRGGRMLNEETYENFWDLFDSVPSLDMPNRSVTEEILNFDHLHPTHAQARLVDGQGEIVDTTTMGFSNEDRLELTKLLLTPEDQLDEMTIEQWFNDDFFETNFWYMWQTTFAFQKWSSVFELRRYMNRMLLEFSRINTLEGVTRTPLNQYESLVLPLYEVLKEKGVDFTLNETVTDIDFANDDTITATRLHFKNRQPLDLTAKDVVMMTSGCMTDSATLGSLDQAPEHPEQPPLSGELWYKISLKKKGLGNPAPFFGKEAETNWHSFTVTAKGDALLKRIEQFSGNIPGSGALMTFKDSNWLMSSVVAAQPHFKSQDPDTTIFWGYGLYPYEKGNFVDKRMVDCTGEEILYEYISHLGWQDDWEAIKKDIVNVIPCYMPYIDAQFQPRKMSDRPAVVPENSTNFAMLGQFVEIPEDMVFTEEYSIRAARIAVYTLFDIDLPIEPVTPHNRNPKVLAKALQTMYR